jgi:hypothetical protein
MTMIVVNVHWGILRFVSYSYPFGMIFFCLVLKWKLMQLASVIIFLARAIGFFSWMCETCFLNKRWLNLLAKKITLQRMNGSSARSSDICARIFSKKVSEAIKKILLREQLWLIYNTQAAKFCKRHKSRILIRISFREDANPRRMARWRRNASPLAHKLLHCKFSV